MALPNCDYCSDHPALSGLECKHAQNALGSMLLCLGFSVEKYPDVDLEPSLDKATKYDGPTHANLRSLFFEPW